MKVLSIVLSVLMLIGCEKKDEKTKQPKVDNVLNVAVSSDYPPFIYSENGKLKGFEVELINHVAEKLGKTVQFHDVDFHGIVKSVAKKEVDCAIAAIGKTEERAKEVGFTTSYHRSMTVILTPISSGIDKLEDLNGKTLGFETDTTYEKYFEGHADNLFNGVQKLQRTKLKDLLSAMRSGKCQAIITGYSEGYEIQNSNPDLKIIPIAGTVMSFSIIASKGSALLQKIDEILEEMLKDGELLKLETHYFKKVVAED